MQKIILFSRLITWNVLKFILYLFYILQENSLKIWVSLFFTAVSFSANYQNIVFIGSKCGIINSVCTQNLPEKLTCLIPWYAHVRVQDTHMYVSKSRGKKSSFFEKFGGCWFLVTPACYLITDELLFLNWQVIFLIDISLFPLTHVSPMLHFI